MSSLWKPGVSGNPGGLTSATKKRTLSLAVAVRSAVEPQVIVEWLQKVWLEGKDPLVDTPVPLKERMDALQILLNRGWGQAAQHVIIEADVRSTLQGIEQAVVPTTLEDVRAKRQALREAGARRKVIDAESTEQRKEMSLDDVMPADE